MYIHTYIDIRIYIYVRIYVYTHICYIYVYDVLEIRIKLGCFYFNKSYQGHLVCFVSPIHLITQDPTPRPHMNLVTSEYLTKKVKVRQLLALR